jgi:hypothetical protein
MTPGVGASDYVIANADEAKAYGGATRLPVTELNNAKKSTKDNPRLANSPRPIHSYQATILFNQGLIKDSDRGSISSSSMRESPSQVFGISTPGRPIYQGGYDDTSVKAAILADEKNENFKIIGRRGGHSFVMDDGDLFGKDQLIRLRTSTGHMILMNDYAQTLMIMHANGQSYIELGREGTIDMYSTNSVNIRTEGDLNLHADRNININAAGDLKMSAKNTKIEALQTMTQYAGDTFQGYSKGDYTTKTESNFATEASGDIGHKAKGTVFINGGKKKPNVKINSGDISTTPKAVGQIGVSVLSDTLFDDTKGYNPAPAKLTSIVNRAPAHMPWADAGKGVDVKVDKSASAAFPSPPSKAITAANLVAPKVPNNPTNTTFAATVPGLTDVSNLTKGLDTTLSNPALTSMVSQMAVTAALGPMGPAVLAGGAGVLSNGNGLKVAGIGNFALNASQMSAAGVIKPGSEVAVDYALNSGKALTQAFPNNIFTGQNGVTNLNQYLNDPTAQAKSAASLLTQGEGALKAAGLITGTEHSTQTAGLIMSTASLGLKATSDFLSGGGAAGAAVGVMGSAKDLVSSGNFAAGLADKSMVALSGIKLGGIDVASAVKGFASGLYSSVLSAFKPLKPNVPQNLTAINAPPDPTSLANAAASAGDLTGAANAMSGIASAATDLATKAANDPQLQGLAMKALEASVPGAGAAIAVAGAIQSGKSLDANTLANAAIAGAVPGGLPTGGIPGVNVASLGGLPGGSDAISNNASNPITGSGIKDISSSIKGISGAINSSELGTNIANAKSLLAGGSLATVAMGGIDPGMLSKLNSLLSSIGHGALNIALPTTISNAFKTDGLLASAKAKLGDKVPPPTFGATKAPEPNIAASVKVDSLAKQLDAEQANYKKLNEAWDAARVKYGVNSPQASDAFTPVYISSGKIAEIESEIRKTIII